MAVARVKLIVDRLKETGNVASLRREPIHDLLVKTRGQRRRSGVIGDTRHVGSPQRR